MTKAGRNLASIFVIVDKYSAGGKTWAVPSSANVAVNSSQASVGAYTINNNNFFKLRDIACILKNTGAAFNVGWDSASNTITIDSVNPGENNDSMSYEYHKLIQEAEKSSSKIIVNGKPVNLEVYKINGSNYFKLRDIAAQINAQVQWDDSTSTINIVTN